MFIGHYAVGLAGKRWAPSAPLWALLLAVQLPDLLWPTLVLLGVEHFRIVPGTTVVTPLDFVSYPYSHSLLFDLLWAVALAVVWWLLRHDRRAALVLGFGVLSHWVLDVVSHRPDMPVLPSGPWIGLELWRSLGATLVVEGALFAVGLALYLKSTRALDRFGRLGPALLVGLLLAAYLGALFGPPPPDVETVAWAGQASWIAVALAWGIDRHRSAADAIRSVERS
ncbi:MAG: hypothetical protein IPJ17_17385 [Holophagales bacterium]|nr:MAG: hypothetical protein IPJ17_17385 [Holophagales bacterium]